MSNEWDSALPVPPAEVSPGTGTVSNDWKAARRKKATLADPLKVDRLPPHSIEAEQGVLGCCMLAPAEALSYCREKLKSGALAFYDLRHQLIYGTMVEMLDAHQSVDLITLQQKLKDRNQLEQVGGLVYLASLPDATPSAANLGYYLEIVREKQTLRRIIGICTEVVSRAFEHQGEVGALLDTIERDLSGLTEAEAVVAEEHMKVIARRVVADLETRHYSRGSTQLRGLPTGRTGNHVDKLLRGIRETFYVVLAGRPGSGKTSWAMNIVEYLAKEYEWWRDTGATREPVGEEQGPQPVFEKRTGIPVCVFSMEMDADCLVERLLFGRARVDSSLFTQGFATAQDFAKLGKAAEDLAAMNIYVDPSPAQTIGQLAAKARRMVKQYGIKLFVLDYMQLVEHEEGNGFDRQKELTKISRKIMALKKQLKVPWIVLAQMNRNIESNEAKDRLPVLSDLKDCGALEQDADVVVFTHKVSRRQAEDGDPSDVELIEKATPGAESRRPYRVDMVVAKNRFGPTGIAKMVFWKNLQVFEDWHQFLVRHNLANAMAGEKKPEQGGEERL